MILVFIFLAIIMLFLCILVFSTIKINISKLELSNCKVQGKIVQDYMIYLGLYLFNHIRLINIPINKEKIEKMPQDKKEKIRQKLKKIEKEEMNRGKIKKEQIKEIMKKLNPKVAYFNLKTQLGTEDVLITTAVVTILSAIIGMGLAKVIKKYDREKYFYEIQPIYQNRNIINLKVKCIICIKMVHIIHIIYFIYKIRRVEKNERTSNRGAYDYSYE